MSDGREARLTDEATDWRREFDVLHEAAQEIVRDRDALAADLAAALAREDGLRGEIEDYLLWEPGKRGHAEAHRRLAVLASAGEPAAGTEEHPRSCRIYAERICTCGILASRGPGTGTEETTRARRAEEDFRWGS